MNSVQRIADVSGMFGERRFYHKCVYFTESSITDDSVFFCNDFVMIATT